MNKYALAHLAKTYQNNLKVVKVVAYEADNVPKLS